MDIVRSSGAVAQKPQAWVLSYWVATVTLLLEEHAMRYGKQGTGEVVLAGVSRLNGCSHDLW